MLVINPKSELEEIIQNVKTIISTPKGSVPLMRDFGVEWQVIDTLTPELELRLKEEVFAQIEKWERRVKVKAITVSSDESGQAKVKVKLKTRYGEVVVSSN